MKFINRDEYGDFCGLYTIKNNITGEVYIGQTIRPFKMRWYDHNCRLKHGKCANLHMQRSYNKYGDDAFTFEPLLLTTSQEDLINDMEMKYIEEARKTGKCFNIHDGGQLSSSHSLGELNRKLNLGKKASLETRMKMSESQKNREHDPEINRRSTKKKAENIKNGTVYKTMKITAEQARKLKEELVAGSTYAELSEKYGVSRSNINAIRSNRSWKFVEVDGWDEHCKHTHCDRRRAKQTG